MENNEKVLREADNAIVMEGVVAEKKIEVRAEKQDITGEIDIRTDENSIHTVRLYAKQFKKDGTENSIYKGIETIMNEYQAIANVGEENADKVRIIGAKLGVNEYYGQDGKLRTFPSISSNFVNRLKPTDTFEAKAEFDIEVFINKLEEELDKEQNETGRLIIEAVVPVYGGKIIPQKFVVANPDAVQYIQSNYEIGSTVRLYGELVNSVVTEEVEKPVAFGKPKKEIKRTTVRELVVTGGSEPYEEESALAYNIEDIKKAYVERNTYLEELKKKSEEKKNGTVANAGKKGFDVSKGAKKPGDKPVLPF